MLSRPKLPWRKALVILFLWVAGGVWGQPIEAQETQDVVYLKNGSVIRGTIVEQVPGESILIETSDGNRFRYLMDDIERMAKEPQPNQGTGQARPLSTKSPGTAVALSALIVGAGQGYNGEWGKAAGFFGGAVVLGGAAIEAANSDACSREDDCSAATAYAVGWIAVAVWSMIDAHTSAKAINERSGRLGWEFTPRPGIRVVETPFGRRAGLEVQLLRWTY